MATRNDLGLTNGICFTFIDYMYKHDLDYNDAVLLAGLIGKGVMFAATDHEDGTPERDTEKEKTRLFNKPRFADGRPRPATA